MGNDDDFSSLLLHQLMNMAASVDDTQHFLNENIKNDQDLNLDHITKLLGSRRSEQANLDSQVSTLYPRIILVIHRNL